MRSQQTALQVYQRHFALLLEDAAKTLTREEKDALERYIAARLVVELGRAA